MPGVTPGNMNGYNDYNGYGRHNERDNYPGSYADSYSSPRRPPPSSYRGSEFRLGLSEIHTARDDDFGRVNNGYEQHSMDSRPDNFQGFEVDHLATYTSSSGAMNVEDGLRKLKHMESTTGIWTMRCLMVVEARDIVIIDKGNGEEQERFPLSSVLEPTAVVDDKNHEVYSNLILFTVKEDPRNKYSPSDMHIFQSTEKKAPHIVDEVLAAKEGRRRPNQGANGVPPRPQGPAPNPPYGGSRWIGKNRGKSYFSYSPAGRSYSSGGQQYSARGSNIDPPQSQQVGNNYQSSSKTWVDQDFHNATLPDYGGSSTVANYASSSVSQRPGLGQSMNPRASFLPNMDDSGQNEVLERDVQLLNCCFDDIERFVSRLQAAAESYKELERRKRDRNARRHKTRGGEGLLNMKARPPPAEDFVDIFQKFKYAFNLLAKLKAHIHDPNAPELVHFLFTPLSLIFEASRDPIHGGADLANHARFPLLAPESKQLLLNCLTSKELELWQALGQHWTTNREEFSGPIEQYNPRFFNGWTPAPQVSSDHNRMMMEAAVNNMGHQIERRNRTYQAPEVDDLMMPYPRPDGRSFRPVERPDESEDMYARSTKPSTQPPPGAIPNTNVAQYQEYVEKHIDRNKGIHQSSRPSPTPAKPKNRQEENLQFTKDLQSQNKIMYEIVHERDGRNEKEITVQKGDIVEVIDSSRNWWKVRNYLGDQGYAPYTIMKEYTPPSNFGADRNDFNNRHSGDYNSSIAPRHNIPAPPPMPPDVRMGARRDSDKHVESSRQGSHRRNDSSDEKINDRRDRRQDRAREKNDRSFGSHNDSNYSSSNEDSIDRDVTWDRNGDRYDDRRDGRHHEDRRDRRDDRRDDGREERRQERPQNPVPPPPPTTRPPAIKKTKQPSVKPKPAPKNDLHDELKKRVSSQVLEMPKGTTYISKYSEPDEVKDWLLTKGFGRHCIKTFDGYNGEELFDLHRKEMNRLLEKDEAHKLESMLLVQKKISNYGTRGGSELRKILEDRKKKAETTSSAHIGSPPSFAPESPDYSDEDSDSSDDLANAGKTLRAMLQQRRRKIHTTTYQQDGHD